MGLTSSRPLYFYQKDIIDIGDQFPSLCHRIGLWENLQESPINLMVKTHGFPVNFPLNQSSDYGQSFFTQGESGESGGTNDQGFPEGWLFSLGPLRDFELRNSEIPPTALWQFNIAMENGPFIDGLPIKNGDFPWLC